MKMLLSIHLVFSTSRNKFSNLSAHSGFDEKLCYGDVTLAFKHTTQPLTNTERSRIDKIRVKNEEAAAAKAESEQVQETEQPKRSEFKVMRFWVIGQRLLRSCC